MISLSTSRIIFYWSTVKSKCPCFSQHARNGFWAGRAGLRPLRNVYM